MRMKDFANLEDTEDNEATLVGKAFSRQKGSVVSRNKGAK